MPANISSINTFDASSQPGKPSNLTGTVDFMVPNMPINTGATIFASIYDYTTGTSLSVKPAMINGSNLVVSYTYFDSSTLFAFTAQIPSATFM